jgi:predicted  nucleic acid-binding Zn-ribbon protein
MLTETDIAKIVAVVATKEDIHHLKAWFDSFEEKFDKLTDAIDKLAGAIQDLRLEYAAVSSQLTRHEEWIKKIAAKAGVKLDY